jgi:DNA end-binding protein Ku
VARSLWSGSISFGLVSIPVRLFSAERDHSVHFHQLNRDTGHRIRYRKVDAESGEEVDKDDIVKGYEVKKGSWVTFDDDELDELRPETTKTIDIEDFVDLGEIDPIYYDRTYFLAPEDNEGARRAYALLLEAMQRMERAGIGKVVMRTKQYLAAVRPYAGILALSTMRFADEVLQPDDVDEVDVDLPAADAKSRKMAESLIDSLATSFDPTRYRDTYTEELEELIEAKAKGETIEVEAAPEEAPKVLDLMAALQASVEAAKGRRTSAASGSGGSPKKKAAPTATKKPTKKASKTASKATGTKRAAAKKPRRSAAA